MIRRRAYSITLIAGLILATGCTSHADRGALFGGLTGAGVGALVGKASGNAGAGAALGAGLGAMTGAVIGDSIDEVEARNRAEIEARLGRPVVAGSVTLQEVVAMTKAGVADDVMVSFIQAHGAAAPLQSSDLIYLKEQGVSTRVVQALQAPQPLPPRVAVPTQPVIIEEHYVGGPYWGPSYHHYHHRPRSRGSWGFAFGF